MRFPSAAIAFAFVFPSIMPAQAAPATAEQAQTIKTSLERYVGSGGSAGSPVTVTPNGEAYDVDLDIKRVLAQLDRFGVTIDPLVYRFTVLPLAGSTWKVTNSGQARFGGKFHDRTFSAAINGAQLDGVFDTAIPAFTSTTATYDSISGAAQGGQGGTQTRETRKAKQNTTATPTGDGVVDTQSSQTSESFVQDVTLDAGAATPGKNAAHVAIKSGPVVEEGKIDGLRIRALSNLWTFLVANPSPELLKAHQAELRTQLLDAIPVVTHMSQSATLGQVAVESPVGPLTAQTLGFSYDISGLTEAGSVGSAIKIDALTLPSGLVPPWAEGLLPTKIDLSEAFSGFHLEAAAREAVRSADLDRKDIFTPETKMKLQALLGPLDQMSVTIAPSRLVSRLLDLKLEGRVRLEVPVPDFDIKVNLAGIDKAVQEVQAKSTDPNIASMMAAVALIKGYGKAEPDGSLSWEVTRNGTGDILINGIVLPMGKSK